MLKDRAKVHINQTEFDWKRKFLEVVLLLSYQIAGKFFTRKYNLQDAKISVKISKLLKQINIWWHQISGGDALRGNTRSHPEHDG